LKTTYGFVYFHVFPAPRKGSFASAVYAMANPSVRLSDRPSITLRYCVKMRERRGMRSSPSGSPMSLVFLTPRMVDRDDPVQVKFECKEVDPMRKQLSCTHFAS